MMYPTVDMIHLDKGINIGDGGYELAQSQKPPSYAILNQLGALPDENG